MIMRILCVYPPFPPTYWGMEYTRRIVPKDALLPPLGLLTVAAMLPPAWQVRLRDMQIGPLLDNDLAWADAVFLSGMLVQKDGLTEVARRARAAGKIVVIGGPYASSLPNEVQPLADCVVVGEAEEIISDLCEALAKGAEHLPKRIVAPRRPDVGRSPVPRFDLVDWKRYHAFGVQWSRGCPFSCEFCDIIELYGRVPRLKGVEQFLKELQALYDAGYRGGIFVVDDNFIGNKKATKELLRAIAAWSKAHSRPFDFYTEASLNLAEDDELIALMVSAGFSQVFIGIETPSKEALKETKKAQNARLDIDAAVKKIASSGLEVMAGFIVGFDADDAAAVARQREWILASPIPMAMTGLLMALPGTQLERRLQREGRLRTPPGGNNFARPNFITRHDERELLKEYERLLAEVYAPKNYYARCLRALRLCKQESAHYERPLAEKMRYFLTSLWVQGVRGKHRGAYWRFLGSVLLTSPRRFARAVSLAIQGEHFFKYTKEDVIPGLRLALAEENG